VFVLDPSLLSGDNAAFVDMQYQSWLGDPTSVDQDWAQLFASLDGPENGKIPGSPPSFTPRSIFAGRANASQVFEGADRQARVAQLINAYRVRGHLKAGIDPLGRLTRVDHPELTLAYYGLTEADLDAVVATKPLYGIPEKARLRDVLALCRAAYCGSIGAEFMNINYIDQKQWVIEQLETLPHRHVLNREEELRILRKLCDAENFEKMLHTRFPGTKRFSLEGGETLVPLLDLVLEHAGRLGVKELVFGMAHRGRLNTLVNTLEKPANLIVEEFQDMHGPTQGSGDVKYHLGYSSDVVTVDGHEVHLSLTPNPSHLEAVNPVVQGRVRAKQARAGLPDSRKLAMPILIHGDAAFIGQGVVQETLNMSEIRGYHTGGTLHIIVNNQIGFTTTSSDTRSGDYATDIARMLAIPIFHVNGEDPRAVAAVVQIAMQWRQKYHRDVVIDMYCYRKHGHNEGDEPSFTQPQMYELIRSRPSPRAVYAQRLVELGDLSQEDVERVNQESFDSMLAASEPKERGPQEASVDRGVFDKGDHLHEDMYSRSSQDSPNVAAKDVDDLLGVGGTKGLWSVHGSGALSDPVDTRVDKKHLSDLLERANRLPESLDAHRKVKRLVRQRLEMARGERPIDWAVGEQAAFATLLDAEYSVRLSGEDVGRGTFSHRHCVFTDIKTGEDYFPLDHLRPGQGEFGVFDSPLSEFGVLGFEAGYALDTPDGLVLWEAQFGDFANGAQVIVDQFISASETKWGRFLGVVMLLPHGYEGQGPEHSSARLERFLVMCAEENMLVVNVTTPAQYFHLLRQQLLRHVRKPLVMMSPKSLLRHPEAGSTLDDLASGQFEPVLTETEDLNPEEVLRLVLCSGKLYYELRKRREELGEKRVALVRVERLYPWPAAEIDAELARYSNASLMWCQEEPANMGAWPQALHWLLEHVDQMPHYAGRPASAAPATGSSTKHKKQQADLIREALFLPERTK
jgi:2-oxoglutarate dehydrogenase E1 component